MKKAVLITGMLLLMLVGIFADEIDKKIIEGVSRKGIDSENIKNISKVDFKNPPKEIAIEDVDDTNLAIYEVDYGEPNPLFVVLGSGKQVQGISKTQYRQFLVFGFGGSSNNSEFLKTGAGASTDAEKGYVMMRKGSITGISTNLETLEGNGNIRIIIYRNGEAFGFGNKFAVSSDGVKTDYDIQSEDIATFEQGDMISVHLENEENVFWENSITTLEILTN